MQTKQSATMSRRSTLVLVMVVGLLAGAIGTVYADHQFSDVSNSHPFHDQIGAVADAGIAGGYDDGTYKPGRDVSRMAMAAFLERGVGHLATQQPDNFDSTTLDDADGDVTITTLQVDIPGVSGGTQRVYLSAEASLFVNTTKANACSGSICNIYLEIQDGSGTPVGADQIVRISGDYGGGAVHVSGVDVAPAGTTQTYTLVARTHQVQNSNAIVSEPGLTAITLPMDAKAGGSGLD